MDDVNVFFLHAQLFLAVIVGYMNRIDVLLLRLPSFESSIFVVAVIAFIHFCHDIGFSCAKVDFRHSLLLLLVQSHEGLGFH